MSFKILFEDEYFLVAEKPAGLPSQPTVDKNRPDFYTLLKKQLQDERGEETYLALHHRLDRDTSGLMIFAKTKEANPELASLFKEHRIQKTYHCLTARTQKCKDSWEVQNHLVEMKDKKTKRSKMVVTNSGGDKAHTLFRKLATFDNALLIEAKPLSGRMHQIRVHLADRGLGIYGDDLYKSPQHEVAQRLMLHAFSLDFAHPFTKEQIHVECPMPSDIIFFMNQLTANGKND